MNLSLVHMLIHSKAWFKDVLLMTTSRKTFQLCYLILINDVNKYLCIDRCQLGHNEDKVSALLSMQFCNVLKLIDRHFTWKHFDKLPRSKYKSNILYIFTMSYNYITCTWLLTWKIIFQNLNTIKIESTNLVTITRTKFACLKSHRKCVLSLPKY